MKKIILLAGCFFGALAIVLAQPVLYGYVGSSIVKYTGSSKDLSVVYSLETGSFTGGPVKAADGKLYGRTNLGIFSFDPVNNSHSSLHGFADTDRGPSNGTLMQASNGMFYGVTSNNEYWAMGGIFSFDPVGNVYVMEKRLFTYSDGGWPDGGLVQASNGMLYGVTSEGGSYGLGVIFAYDPGDRTYAKVHDFDGTNGSSPYGTLMKASNGKLYGITGLGGANNYGVLFSFNPSTGGFSVLKHFDGINGASSYGGLVQASDGKLYGIGSGGSYNAGVIFSYDPVSGSYAKVRDFNKYSDGGTPAGGLMQASNRKLYGMTVGPYAFDFDYVGDGQYGVVFSFDLVTGTYTIEQSLTSVPGNPTGIYLTEVGSCPTTPDGDGDGLGDACDDDDDGDGVPDSDDNCPSTPNAEQTDTDGDLLGNACDPDDDNDGTDDVTDNCPLLSNPDQADADRDGLGDVCDEVNNLDEDGDGVPDSEDNCPAVSNPEQTDTDGDLLGDACDPDDDNDGIDDVTDNCPLLPNADQANADSDLLGDVCDGDDDNDGVADEADNCPTVSNPDQADADRDGLGDVCDPVNNLDGDGDGVPDAEDNCPSTANAEQTDMDGDGLGNACDPDADGDGTDNIGDCDDLNAAIHPGAPEICDRIDNDCNGLIDDNVQQTYYRDRDGDGYGDPKLSTNACPVPAGYVENNIDCNDNDATVYPAAPEVCDGKDNDCDGQFDEGVLTSYYRDADGDGYGSATAIIQACAPRNGYVSQSGDCDDRNAGVNPVAAEICGNGLDDDCDGEVDDGCILVSIESIIVYESDGVANLKVSLSDVSTLDVKVSYQTQTGTAGPRDFKSAKGTLTIPAGSTEAIISITIIIDKFNETNEKFWVNLSNPVNATIGIGSGGVIIQDVAGPIVTKAEKNRETEWVTGGLKVKVLPNPSSRRFTLVSQSSSTQPMDIKVVDMLGRVVEARSKVAANGTYYLGKEYRPGVYHVQVIQGSQRQTLKLVKQPH